MSKTVIVFSTRFISPLVKNGLFSDATPIPFSSVELSNYFWNRIDNDDRKRAKYLQSILTENYFKKETLLNGLKIEENKQILINEIKRFEKDIKAKSKSLNINISINYDSFDWLTQFFKSLPERDYNQKKWTNLSTLSVKYDNEKISLDAIKKKIKDDSTWICKNLISDLESNQEPINLDNYESKIPGPWLAYRFSYYKHDISNNQVAIYAVWPLLHSSQKDTSGKYPWVEALTDQFLRFNQDAQDLYLVLHDADIEKSIFKVLGEDTGVVQTDNETIRAQRHIALFQHVDKMGAYLKNPPNGLTPEDVLRFVEDAFDNESRRQMLCDALDYILENNFDNLCNLIDKLQPIDQNISSIVDRIKNEWNNSLENCPDEQKLRLISLFNFELRKVMIETNPKD